MNKILVIIVAIVCIIFWHKKINPETTWIYAIYVIVILSIDFIMAKEFL